MDAHLFRLFCEAALPLLQRARIGKIQEPAAGHLVIPFHGGGRRLNLFMRFGRKDPFSFVGTQRLPAPSRPSAQMMRMRKYFTDRRIAAAVAQVWSRKLWLMPEGSCESGRAVWLCLDLAAGPAISFLDAVAMPDPEQEISWPRAADLTDADWHDWPVLTPALRRSLSDLSLPDKMALLADLQDGGGDLFLYADPAGIIQKASAWPLSGTALEEVICEDVLTGLERAGQDLLIAPIFTRLRSLELEPGQRRKRQIEKMLAKLGQDRQRLQKMMARREDAEAIRANLWMINAAEKRANIELEGRKILLRPDVSIRGNMERWFHDARRGSRGLQMLAEREKALKEELLTLGAGSILPGETAAENQRQAQSTKMPSHVAAFMSSDGYMILRGKDTAGNMKVRRMAAGHDIWAHVETGPGAHVVIRLPHPGHVVPEKTLIEAGQLAINKSWLNGSDAAAVMYAEARHVKPDRKKGPGQVRIDKLRETRLIHANPGKEDELRKL